MRHRALLASRLPPRLRQWRPASALLVAAGNNPERMRSEGVLRRPVRGQPGRGVLRVHVLSRRSGGQRLDPVASSPIIFQEILQTTVFKSHVESVAQFLCDPLCNRIGVI